VAGEQGASDAGQRLADAQKALRADGDIQFDLPPVTPRPPPPQWWLDFLEWLGRVLSPVGRFFNWIGSFLPDAPYARIVLWTALALAAAALTWMLWRRLRDGKWSWPRRRATTTGGETEDDLLPDAAPARRWLEEADRLAADSRFAEAVHHLLLRSVEDIARRRPQLVRPALTSRDLSRAEAIPRDARSLFAGIAQVVERSLFGGRPVDAGQWQACRASYADFIASRAWKG
jgi:hypothetical protein